MTQDSSGAQQAQDADDQRAYGGEPVGQADEEQAQREELEYGDSSTAVSPDTQFSDPGEIGDDGEQALSSQGQSTTWHDPAKPRGSSDVDQGPHGDEMPRPPGTADEDRNPDQADAFAGTTDGDQDAEPPTSGYGEQPEVISGDDVDGESTGETSYGDDQDAAPSQAPYEQR